MDGPEPFLAAVLIVKDEEAVIAESLLALANIADVIRVHDTGSTDSTVEIAKSFGAEVTHGEWTHDFAAARNDAIAGCRADWILMVDADEVVSSDRAALVEYLRTAKNDAFRIRLTAEPDGVPYDYSMVRLFRRGPATWVGRVHEQLVGVSSVADMPLEILKIFHGGYTSHEKRVSRANRNAELAQLVIDDPASEPAAIARAYVDLGRSYVIVGRAQDAADAFEAVREKFADAPEWKEATDFLARLVLAEGMYPETLALAQELCDRGVSSTYCDWLAAQALVQLGKFEQADELLANVHEVVDTSGRAYNPAALVELKSLVAQLRALNS